MINKIFNSINKSKKMTYASIEEVWGGISGSSQLNTPLNQKLHPIQEKRIREEEIKKMQRRDQLQRNLIQWKKDTDPYQCMYNSQPCQQSVQQNHLYNQQQKLVAQGLQQQGLQQQSNGILLPQYPWYPQIKQNYLMYPPYISQMWYQNPWQYRPDIALQIYQQQLQNPYNYSTPIGPYTGTGFYPNPNETFPPQPQYPQPQSQSFPGNLYPRNLYPNNDTHPNVINKRRENFTENFINENSGEIKSAMIYFVFFLIAIAVILCIFMICVACTGKK